MKEVGHDIVQRIDVKTLVDRFYDKVKKDKLLGPVFNHVDWPQHLPIMYDFWSSMLLGDQSYRGNPLQRHLHLQIDKSHEKAEEVKMRAQSIAGIFQMKMGLMTKN